jgi:putative FmdB family regulatory protein
MPNYDFTCITCDKTTEMHMTYDSLARPICSKCGNFMIKSYTPPAVHFKGGGWGGQ